MPTFRSGAFVQQCFASHPLSLSFKALPAQNRVVLVCGNCQMRHRMAVRALLSRTGEEGAPLREATEDLGRCAAGHPADLRVSAVDVVQDAVKLRCGSCRRTYAIEVAAFETYQKEG